MTSFGEALRGVDAGADRGAAERQRTQAGQRVPESGDAVLDLRGVAAELLAERDRGRVHQMRAAGLHDLGELALLRAQGLAPDARAAGIKSSVSGGRGREVHRRREHVVRRLRRVDVRRSDAPARRARRKQVRPITSFAFMFDDVPEPVWNTSIGKWSSSSPAATSFGRRRDGVADRFRHLRYLARPAFTARLPP